MGIQVSVRFLCLKILGWVKDYEMSITDELTNMVNPHILTGLQTQHLMSPTPTCNILSGFLRKKMGAAGNGVQISDLIEQGDGRFYRGLDTAENRRSNEGTVRHFEEWSNLQEDVVLAGTQLQEVLGMTSSDVVKADTSLSNFPESDRLQMINLGAMRAEQAAISGLQDVDRALWGEYLPNDNRNRMPMTLDEVYDEAGQLHGIGPDDLGEWEPAKQVWAEKPANDAKDTRRNVPQIFFPGDSTDRGERDYTAPADADLITTGKVLYEKLLEANVKMSANVAGYWICPLQPEMFLSLDRYMFTLANNYKVPLYAGAKYTYRIECIRIQNSYYYIEQRAPNDRARHIHIGQMDGSGGSFFPLAWSPKQTLDIMELLSSPDPTPKIDGMPMGNAAMTWPWWMEMWQKSERYASAIFCELELKWMWLCTYRWKQFEVRGIEEGILDAE